MVVFLCLVLGAEDGHIPTFRLFRAPSMLFMGYQPGRGLGGTQPGGSYQAYDVPGDSYVVPFWAVDYNP